MKIETNKTESVSREIINEEVLYFKKITKYGLQGESTNVSINKLTSGYSDQQNIQTS